MKNNMIISAVKSSFFSFVFAIEVSFVFFLIFHISKIDKEIVISLSLFIMSFTCAFLLQLFFKKQQLHLRLIFSFAVPGLVILLSILIFSFCKIDNYISTKKNSDLIFLDSGKEAAFNNHKVLILVPHQDDEIAICGGTIELFKKYNSDIYVAFSSSGDMANYYYPEFKVGSEMGQIRCREAIKVLSRYGIPDNHIYFMGYGNYWNGNISMYNQPDTKELVSCSGLTNTYAIPEHLAYNNGVKYTRENYKNDLKNLINSLKPDTIFCIDCDKNLDHKELSLMFEEVMGCILKETNGMYQPAIFKGFAYNLSLYSENDYFYTENNNQTFNPYKTDYLEENHSYLWQKRVRFPVSIVSQTKYPESSTTGKAIIDYHTQFINTNDAECSSNSDKVFWERRTDSILYTSNFQVSSGNSTCLNDFKLSDTSNLTKDNRFDDGVGVWIPDGHDKIKSVLVNLSKKSDIYSIVIYDNVSVDDNILETEIRFDNGKILKTGPLDFNGSGTEIIVDEKNVKSFEIIVLDSEGNKAGISEIEAYPSEFHNSFFDFIKIIDQNANFIYNYYTRNEKNVFSLYRYGNVEELSKAAYSVSVDNKLCTADITDNGLEVLCPKNKKCTVTLESYDKKVSDTIRINNCSNSLLGRKIQILYREKYTPAKQIEYLKLIYSGSLEIFHHFFG